MLKQDTFSPENLAKLAELATQLQTSGYQETPSYTDKFQSRIQFNGLWKNPETEENECFFGSGKLILRRAEKEKIGDADYALFYEFEDGKKTISSKVTGLWVNKGKEKIYLSGSLGSMRLFIFTNDEKKEDKHPTYLMYVMAKQIRQSVNPDEFALV